MKDIKDLNFTIKDFAEKALDSWLKGEKLSKEQAVILYLTNRLFEVEKKLEEIQPTLT